MKNSPIQLPLSQVLSAQHFFLIGIKGVGMAALASCLCDMGKSVSGWDVTEDFVTQPMLNRLHITVTNNNSLPEQTEVVVYTAAHHDSLHPLVIKAMNRHLPCFSLAEICGLLSQRKPTIAVCGVGGKTTTSAMLAWIMNWASPPASYLVGVGEISGLPTTGAWHDQSETFIIEADEYAANPSQVALGQPPIPRFFTLSPQTIICTHIVHDHPDVYPTFEDTKRIFLDFFQKLPDDGLLILNADDTFTPAVIQHFQQGKPNVQILTVGQSQTAGIRLTQLTSADKQTTTLMIAPLLSDHPVQLTLRIPGIYNLWNAAAAMAAAAHHGVSIQKSLAALSTFASTSRRMEKVRQTESTLYYDDYAHHPLEISASIQALRDWYPAKSICVFFQPHTFSRTKALLSEFAQSLHKADRVVLLPIFASARESKSDQVSSMDIANKLQSSSTPCTVCATIAEGRTLFQQASEDIIITMGAGDVYTLHDKPTHSK